MPIFTISYDLIKRKDYESLWDALKKHKAQRVLKSVWLLNANNTPQEIRDWLKSYVDADDKIFVCQTATDKIYGFNLESGTNEWLKNN